MTEPSAATPPARVLAEFAAALRWDAMPRSTRERAKDLLLDALASAIGGVDDPGTAVVSSMARMLTGPGASTVIGGGSSLSLAGATLVNAHLVSSVSLCDVHYATWCHLTPQVVPAALAVGEHVDATGEAVLLAIAAGCELTARIGLGANYPALHARGWNASGVFGAFGAAIAAGLLLGLDSARLTHALGIAGGQAAGSDAQRGTPTVRFHQPRAALMGVVAAQLAAEGFTAMTDVLTNPAGGLYFTHSDGGTPEAAFAELGTRWELEHLWLTPWPLALLARNIVNTVLDLAVAEDLHPAEVERITVSLSSRAYELYGTMPFDEPSRARTSARYLTAVTLRDHACESAQFSPAAIRDAAIGAFARTKVDVVADPSLAERAVRVEARGTDGRVRSRSREVAHGDASDPLTREEIVAKFRSAAAPHLRADHVDAVLDLWSRLEQLTVRPLLVALGR